MTILVAVGMMPSPLPARAFGATLLRQRRRVGARTPLQSSALSTTTSSVTTTDTANSASSNAAVALKHMEYGKVDAAQNSSSSFLAKEKPAALFLHGLLGNKRNFASIGASLSQQIASPRRLIGLDLRNHGENQHDWRDDMTYASMAADVLHFCDVQGLDHVELIGHSVGGKVAQAVALLQPERIKGLVVIDIAPVRYTPDEPHWKAVQDIIQALMSVTVQPNMTKREVDVQLRSSIPDPALRAFCLTNFQNGNWNVPLPYIRSQLDTLAGFDVPTQSLSSIAQFTGDAFFIHGGQSRFVRHQHLETIGEYFPNHMLTTIRGAGHWVHAEAPEDTTALLQRFLDR
jgi:esterase